MRPSQVSPQEILQLLTYRRQDFDSKVLSVSTNRVHFNESPAISTLGDLDKLSIELLYMILHYSDLCTASAFCLLNRQARMVVHASLPYKNLVRHAPHAIAALIRTRVGSHFTVDEVFHTFCTPSCYVCGRFGAFLWIPECIRCCFPCLRAAPELMPMGENHAKAVFGLTKKTLAKVPIMVTLPGTYGFPSKPYIRQRHLLSRNRARQVAIMTHGGEEELAQYMESRISQSKLASNQLEATQKTTRDDVTRFMATISFPYFDPASRTVDVGLACQGCKSPRAISSRKWLSSKQKHTLVDIRDRTYCEKGFFEHLKRCLDAQRLWDTHRLSDLSKSPGS